jgi:hypothetical protein
MSHLTITTSIINPNTGSWDVFAIEDNDIPPNTHLGQWITSSLSAHDIGCEPGTELLVELRRNGHVIDHLFVRAD